MPRHQVTQKQFDDFTEIVRTHVADRVELKGHPEHLEVCVKAYDPSPGREFWVEVQLEPKPSKKQAKDPEPEPEPPEETGG